VISTESAGEYSSAAKGETLEGRWPGGRVVAGSRVVMARMSMG